jgi:hypothetical protein
MFILICSGLKVLKIEFNIGSLAVAVAGFTGREWLGRPAVVASILAASACWVAAAAGFHLDREGRKAAAVWALLPSSFILAHGLAAREHQTIRVLFEYCGSLLLAYIVRDLLIYPAAWIDVLGTIAVTPVSLNMLQWETELT